MSIDINLECFLVKSLDSTSSTVDILNENYCELDLVTLKIKQ
jgi:hypothetical protein